MVSVYKYKIELLSPVLVHKMIELLMDKRDIFFLSVFEQLDRDILRCFTGINTDHM